MGTELMIALGALVIALIAFSLTQAMSKQLEAESKIHKAERDKLASELNSRIADVEEIVSHRSEGTDHIRQLKATVKVLELRALEHDALLCSLVTEDEAHHLWNVSRDEPILYECHEGVENELRSLVRRGFLRKRGEFKIHELPREFDLQDRFTLTETGEMLLALRKHLKATDTRPQESLPPPAPESRRRSAPPPFVRPTGTGG
jgi:hypothetical protein